MPSGPPLKHPTIDDIRFSAEQARWTAQTYEGNPRNYEDKWYAFWSRWLDLWTFYIRCRCIQTSQDAAWALKGLDIEKEQRKIRVVPRKAEDAVGDSVEAPDTLEDDPAPDVPEDDPAPVVPEDGPAPGLTQLEPQETDLQVLRTAAVAPTQSATAMGPGGSAKSDQASISKGKEKARAATPQENISAASHTSQETQSGRSGTIERIPDSTIIAYYTPRLTPAVAKKVLKHREQLAQGRSKEDGAHPPGYPVNPIKCLRPLHASSGVTEFKMLIGEHKGDPSRRFPRPNWYDNHGKRRLEGQGGATIQGLIYLSNLEYHSHQDALLLLASVGDTWMHSIMRRIDDGNGGFKIEMDEWSAPVIAGSSLSDAREKRLFKWLNDTFPEDLAHLAARRKLKRRNATPEPAEANTKAPKRRRKVADRSDLQPHRYNTRSAKPQPQPGAATAGEDLASVECRQRRKRRTNASSSKANVQGTTKRVTRSCTVKKA
ncbi:hypothetical protein GGG16DRAFT_115531 [Schizophyllum commune]